MLVDDETVHPEVAVFTQLSQRITVTGSEVQKTLEYLLDVGVPGI